MEWKKLKNCAQEHNDKTRESAVCESSIENLRTLMLWFGPKHDDRIYLVEQTNEPLARGVADVGPAVGESHEVGHFLSCRGLRFHPQKDRD